MRLIHLSDLHIGFRQFQRLSASGVNQREADVEDTVLRAAERIAELAPDVIVLGGDIFHNVRPSNPAILHAFRIFSSWRARLPKTPIVIAAGNHDAPRTSETGCILQLFREIGVHVADRAAECFAFPELSLVVLAVPDVPGIKRPELVPPTGYRHRVLLMHGEVAGMLPAHMASSERAAIEIPVADLNASQWSYIALGHYHVCREVAPRAWYSGSVDYTSSNPWGELREERERSLPGKGFIERDLETGRHTFHHVPPARPLFDLTPVDAREMTASQIDDAIRARVESVPGGIDGAIVRLVVQNAARHLTRELDHAALRRYRTRAMHFQLDTHRPVAVTRSVSKGSGTRRVTLRDVVSDRLNSRNITPGIDRPALVAMGLRYLDQAEQMASAALPSLDE